MEWFYAPPDSHPEGSSGFEEFSVSLGFDNAGSNAANSKQRKPVNEASQFEEFSVSLDSPNTAQSKRRDAPISNDMDDTPAMGPSLEALTAFRDAMDKKK